MAEYTIELRHVVERRDIFDFAYPFYDESKRKDFERKFIRHFYFREIGAETIDRFLVYLEDKFNIVLPYYNTLFEAALIEYDKIYNYDLTETQTISRENRAKSDGVSSAVGQFIGDSETENKQNRVVDSEGNVKTVNSDSETETTDTETADTEKETTATTVNKENTKNGSVSKDTSESETRKFLDTPQGAVDLSNSKYLTTLNQDSKSGSEDVTTTETEQGNETSNLNRDVERNGTTETTRNLDRDGNVTQDSTGKETTNDTVNGSTHDEQKTTNDSNTRLRSESSDKEVIELKRYGNIGIQTASDILTKHVELQKVLSSIERLFFDQCEDLFMLVY